MIKVNDQEWGRFNQRLLEAMKTKNWSTMQGCYNEMAYIVAQEGKSANHLIKERNRCELHRLKEDGFKKVQILTARNVTCTYCASLEGRILTIEEALETMPIPGNCFNNDIFD